MWFTTDEMNFVPALPPKFYDNTITTTFPCAVVNIGKYDSMVAIVSVFNPSSGTVIWVNEYNSLTPTGAGAAGTTGNYLPVSAGNVRYSGTTGGTAADTLSARTALATTSYAATGIAATVAGNYYIEIKNADLDQGYNYVAVAISSSATASSGIAVNYIMKPRYPQKTMSTAIS